MRISSRRGHHACISPCLQYITYAQALLQLMRFIMHAIQRHVLWHVLLHLLDIARYRLLEPRLQEDVQDWTHF